MGREIIMKCRDNPNIKHIRDNKCPRCSFVTLDSKCLVSDFGKKYKIEYTCPCCGFKDAVEFDEADIKELSQ